MKASPYKSLALALSLVSALPLLASGCGGSKEDTANQEAKAQAAMEKGASPQSDKGQSFQAPPAPPP